MDMQWIPPTPTVGLLPVSLTSLSRPLSATLQQVPATIDDERTLDLVKEGLYKAGVIPNPDGSAEATAAGGSS